MQSKERSSEMKRVKVYVSGVVQGVGFRYFTKKVAREIGVRGYVMNLNDGRVLVVAEGEEEQIEKLISALKVGPKSAIVKNVEVIEEEYKGEFENFEVRY